ncbi:glycoside hydrolase family 36 protein [Photobacterium satsumensis]|uniref:glycoside hydrolase family 36 protein n=1 Tax=Photobacterium satsumensis TaxID=2910239 RepID=UPI003D0C0665
MKKLLSVGKFNVCLEVGDPSDSLRYGLSSRIEGDVIFIDISLKAESPRVFPECKLDVACDLNDMHSLWTPCLHGHPKSIRNKGIPEIWPHFSSHISHVSPVGCFYNLEGKNKVAFAFSDMKNIVRVHAGAYEEDKAAKIIMHLFSTPTEPMAEYHATLRLDMAAVNYHQALSGISRWHEELIGNSQMPVPASALEPVYSTWYAFHQHLSQDDIEQQCRVAAEMGCKTIILDDGWQTDDSNRGYKFCGDWEVSANRFPDMAAHVERVQAMGMKYLLWLSVPFVGRGCRVWQEFESSLLFYSEQNQTGTLDPRYPKVRDFLVGTYTRLVREYHLDGLKLDFIDEFDMSLATGKALVPDAERDTESLPEAVDRLMMAVRESLLAIKPDILIEFRQRYIGSMIRKYGNIFRVHDCPHDSITNRVGIMDLRLFSGNTAIHSDMFIWSETDTAESASLQFINTLFSVPQISPNLITLPDEHLQMCRHWLSFWNEHKPVLLHGKLKSCYPEMHYPIIESQLNKKKVITFHAAMICDVFTGQEEMITVVNGAMADSVCIKSVETVMANISVFDCLGQKVSDIQNMELNGIKEIPIPKSGYLKIEKVNI